MNDSLEKTKSRDMEKEYDNSGRVDNAAELIDAYILDAETYCSNMVENIEFGQTYGPKPRNKLDIFWPGKNRDVPIAMFIHGGYWQRLDRAGFSHMAKGLNAHGVAVAIPSYTLCPEITISGIIDELRRASIVLWKTYDRPISVFGHSAGGHLAACMLATNWNRIHKILPERLVTSALSISGVFELAPLIETSLNQALKLTPEEARTASPSNWIIDPGLRFDAWVGAEESSEFLRQARDQAQRWRMMGAETRYKEIAGANHFTAIDPLTDPDSAMVHRLLELMQPVEEPTIESLNIPEYKPKPPVDDIDNEVPEEDPVNDDQAGDSPSQEAKPVEGDVEETIPPADDELSTKSATEDPPEENSKDDQSENKTDTRKNKNKGKGKGKGKNVKTEPEQSSPNDDESEAVASTDEAIEVPADPEPQDKAPSSDEEVTADTPSDDDAEFPADKQSPTEAVTTNEGETSEPDEEIEVEAESPPPPTAPTEKPDPDDLTIINGVNKVLQQRLNDLGFSTFEQIAELTQDQKSMIEDILDLEGRIDREHWITQSRHQFAIKSLSDDKVD